ncbi:related to methyltransferase [Phialocephala subalpina]|uniref:Related to methyltransferase n=1 Tax=Phialocephala subalpina TaxID=576137 RepID=A0A1L7XQW8_9HELO|nr:related to methyltransferase [Phialocephala subalpina]
MSQAPAQSPGDVIQVDENASQDFEDEANDTASVGSSLTSVTSSILKGKVEEGGRTYAVYGKEEYGLPMDEQELDRIDMCHAKYYALLNKKRFLAPLPKNPQKILDLGCGTGIWCIDMADEFPSAQVIGSDIAPTQPGWVPPNCRFELDDIEEPWTWKENSFDFIFSRDLIASVRNFPKLIDQCYTHLKPGGYVEFQCVTGILQSDDDTVPKDSALRKFSDSLKSSCDKYGTPIDDPTRWKGWFEDCGFEDVTQQIVKLPCNTWPKDKRMKLLGAWEMENLLSNLEGMVMRLFQRALGWTDQEVTVFLVDVRKDIKNRNIHAYWPYYVVSGRKPGGQPAAV